MNMNILHAPEQNEHFKSLELNGLRSLPGGLQRGINFSYFPESMKYYFYYMLLVFACWHVCMLVFVLLACAHK